MPEGEDGLDQAYRYWHDLGFDEGYELGYEDGWQAATGGGDSDDERDSLETMSVLRWQGTD